MDVKLLDIKLKWCGQEFLITDLTNFDTVEMLKHEIFKKTQVRPERQKLINLKYKNKFPTDDLKLHQFEMMNKKPTIMMVGSLEKDIQEVQEQKPDTEVLSDLETNLEEDEKMENREVYLAKVNKRVREYEITELNPPREGKKLLVLDIDYTLFDHRSPAETGAELMRPYLHEFLESAYEDYDIVIWSATSMRW